MNVSTQTQAVLLLTAWFSGADRSARPLTPPEWGRFALWLKERGAAPEVLLSEPNPARILEGWSDRSVTANRISQLLERSAALGLALEKWERAGLWVMTRSESDYPTRLKKHLKFDAPPVLFGCGNRQLLSRGGVAIVGSRDASDMDLEFTREIAASIAAQGASVISGGARGVDEAAMLGALEREGTIIGVLADSLLRAASSAKFRKGLLAGNAVLISPFNPEAGFDVGNAMSRNKYIYCLSDAAIVIATSKGKGGTWNGAIENLRSRWVPLWVRRSDDADSGSAALVEAGARWLPESSIEIDDLLAATTAPVETHDMFAARPSELQSAKESPIPYVTSEPEARSLAQIAVESEAASDGPTEPTAKSVAPSELEAQTVKPISLFDHFLAEMSRITGHEPLTAEAICERLELHKSQAAVWLKRAVSEGSVVKLKRPVRYQIAKSAQSEMFKAP